MQIQRLFDKAKRWAHLPDDPKRVLLWDNGSEKVVITSYIEANEKNKKLFNNNITIYENLAGQDIIPKLLAKDEFNLVFAAEYAGKEMPVYMENAGLEDVKDKIKQSVEIIEKISDINKKQHPFVLPERFKRFQKFYKESGKFDDLPQTVKDKLGKFYDDTREFDQQNRQKMFDYGYGVSAADFQDFVVDEKGRVRAIDFDELIEFYDPYYCYGYFYVSLERTEFKEELRKYMLWIVNFDQPDAEYRFKLGAVAAMSNQLRISHSNAEAIEKRLGEIYDFLKRKL